MRVTHYGHAALLVETDAGARLLFDPGTMSSGLEGLTDLTAIMITHGHDDHYDPTVVARLLEENPDAVFLTDPETARDSGARPVAAGDHIVLPGATIDVVGGAHAFVYDQVPTIANAGYLVDGGAFFHGGDSYELPGVPVDVLAVPISGPWVKLGESIGFAKAVAPRVVVPMHEGALAHTGQAHGMLRAFLPEATTISVLDPGIATRI
ncbi:MBL fold metallo-hydrolase [uncultured Microbacterium sp.]|uniref:MBL fold metallo-hydrolase n=1 Tax=uncultured Microbacterium sp. TaxID=191216 RepID=UPI0028D255E0|nr:MBL fold metallo-hydrolase [uncultured Microbacterium sp.]